MRDQFEKDDLSDSQTAISMIFDLVGLEIRASSHQTKNNGGFLKKRNVDKQDEGEEITDQTKTCEKRWFELEV